MSSTEPPTPPAPDPPAPPPDPPANPIQELIDRLSSFDPGEIQRRLSELEASIGSSQIVTGIRDAIGPVFTELDSTLKAVIEAVSNRPLAPEPAPTPPAPTPPGPDPPAPPAPAPPTPPGPEEPTPTRGLLDSLFSVPTVPPGA